MIGRDQASVGVFLHKIIDKHNYEQADIILDGDFFDSSKQYLRQLVFILKNA